MSKFLDKTGLDTFWAKIKNTFVKLSDKGVAEGVASLDSDAKLPTSQLPVKNFYASEAKTILVCRVPYFTSTSGSVSAFEMTCRWRAGSAKLFVNLHGNSSNGSNTVSILLNGSLNINELEFYRVKVTVDEKSYFDIYVSVPAYHRCFIAPSVTSSSYADYSVYNANATMPAIGTNTDADETAGKAILIQAKFIAQGVSSSNDAPVKVDASGNLSAVDVDSSPTAGNSTHLVSSDGIKTALDGKANSSDIPQATTTSPKMDGTASAGSETKWAKGDHRHPTDTSREAAANKKTTLDSSSDTDFPTSKAVASYVGTAIANKVDKETGKGLSTNDFSDEEKDKLNGIARWKSKIAIGGTSNTDWYKFASIVTDSSLNESVLGVWDVYCTRRGSGLNHSFGTLFFDAYKGSTVRRADFFTSDKSAVKFCYKIIGSTGNITIELYASIPDLINSSVKFVERASGNSRQAYIPWDYASYGTDNPGEAKPVSGTGVVVDDFAQKTYLYIANVKSEYSSTGTDPVNGTAVAAAINALNVTSQGGDGKYIKAISEAGGMINATEETMDTTPTASSSKPVTSGGVKIALDGKVDARSAWLKTSSGDNKAQWFTMASINSMSTYNDLSGIWDLYLKTRGQGADGKYVMHALLELSVYTGRYDGTDGTHEQTSPIVRKARLIVEPGWPVEILLRITGKTGNVTVEIMTGNFVAITNGNPCAFYMSERAKSYVNQTREWTYGQWGSNDTGDPRPASGDNVTVISLDETDASGKYVYRRTYLYDKDVKSTYIPTGDDSDAPVNGKALADALANGVAAHSSTSDAASYAESAKDYYAGGNIDSTLRALTSEVNGVVTSLSQQYASIMIKERVSVFCTCHPYAGDVVADRGVVLDLKQIYVLSNWDSVTDLSPTSRTGLVEFGKICGLTNPSFEFSEWIRDAVHVVINIAGNGGQYYNKFEINVEDLQIGRYKFLTLNNMTGSSLTIRINSASLGMYLLLHGSTVQIPERSYHDYVIGAGVCKHVSIIRLPDQIIQGATLTTMRQLVFLADT